MLEYHTTQHDREIEEREAEHDLFREDDGEEEQEEQREDASGADSGASDVATAGTPATTPAPSPSTTSAPVEDEDDFNFNDFILSGNAGAH